jgi:NDP-sugar pyrophosphorylase family protein
MPSVPDALVLCGGAGLQVRSVTGGGPKSMAKIGVRPFLELLLRQLQRHGFRRVILAEAIDITPGVQISLEREVFPRWLAEGRKIRGFVASGRCFDIGTADRYQSAQNILADVEMDMTASLNRS